MDLDAWTLWPIVIIALIVLFVLVITVIIVVSTVKARKEREYVDYISNMMSFENLVGENNTSDTTEDKKVSSEKDVESYDFDDPVEDAVERDSLGEGYSNNVDKKIFNESYLSYISTFQRKKPQSKQRGNILNHFSTGKNDISLTHKDHVADKIAKSELRSLAALTNDQPSTSSFGNKETDSLSRITSSTIPSRDRDISLMDKKSSCIDGVDPEQKPQRSEQLLISEISRMEKLGFYMSHERVKDSRGSEYVNCSSEVNQEQTDKLPSILSESAKNRYSTTNELVDDVPCEYTELPSALCDIPSSPQNPLDPRKQRYNGVFLEQMEIYENARIKWKKYLNTYLKNN